MSNIVEWFCLKKVIFGDKMIFEGEGYIMSNISISKDERNYDEMRLILRGISHELGNALTVMGYSIKSIGKEKNILENENYKYLNEDYDYLCKLFRNLSAYNNSRDLELEKIDLNVIVRSVVNSLKEQYLKDNINLEYDEKKESMIFGDKVKLKQVLINILKNAYEAILTEIESKEKLQGRIDININEDENEYIISVKDNGCGISKEGINRIFEPMYTANKEGGTGLGLSVCKNIIECHKGSICASSEKGVGTTFIIKINKA